MQGIEGSQFGHHVVVVAEAVAASEHLGYRAEIAVKGAAARCQHGHDAELLEIANQGQVRPGERAEVLDSRAIRVVDRRFALAIGEAGDLSKRRAVSVQVRYELAERLLALTADHVISSLFQPFVRHESGVHSPQYHRDVPERLYLADEPVGFGHRGGDAGDADEVALGDLLPIDARGLLVVDGRLDLESLAQDGPQDGQAQAGQSKAAEYVNTGSFRLYEHYAVDSHTGIPFPKSNRSLKPYNHALG